MMREYAGQLSLIEPRARAHDPATARAAAESVKPGNAALIKAIRAYLWEYGASTAFEVADVLEGRWAHDTIRTACARAGLVKFPGGETPRGHACVLYALPVENVKTNGLI